MGITDTNHYGYCPICGEAGRYRKRRPNGNDQCSQGHTYLSSSALDDPPLMDDESLLMDDVHPIVSTAGSRSVVMASGLALHVEAGGCVRGPVVIRFGTHELAIPAGHVVDSTVPFFVEK